MSTRREHPTYTTSARQARRGARRTAPGSESPGPAGRPSSVGGVSGGRPAPSSQPGTDGQGAGDDAFLDGLFTYCLSVMCDHDEAVRALGLALAVAERQRERERAPDGPGRQRPWLYAFARWACLHRMHALQESPQPKEPVKLSGPLATERRKELSALGWPEAAGTTPEQREALELAVRHQLPVEEVAAVLSMEVPAARLLLSSAACEVERTRAALSVVGSGGCATVSRLGGDTGMVLSAALRRELVRHVDECGECRLAAERHIAGEPWPGTAPGPSRQLAVLSAPRPAVHAALVSALRARSQPMPRFDRVGFPAEAKDRAARLSKLRARAVTTTVVAAVVAAPVLALWAAYRGAPLVGEGRDGAAVAASESDDPGAGEYPYENAGNADRADGSGPSRGGDGQDGSVTIEKGPAEKNGEESPDDPSASEGPPGEGSESPDEPPTASPGELSVQARPAGQATLITLTNTGGTRLGWSAHTDARWLRLSQHSGQLEPGETFTLRVTVLRRWEPQGPWSARVHFAPANAVITIEGQGREPEPTPSEPEPSQPEPEPEPSVSAPAG